MYILDGSKIEKIKKETLLIGCAWIMGFDPWLVTFLQICSWTYLLTKFQIQNVQSWQEGKKMVPSYGFKELVT